MKNMISKLISLYDSVFNRFEWPQSLLLFFLRFFWGISFIQTGLGKLQHLDKITGFFTSLGIPFPGFNAALVGTFEFGGGILLLIGLFSRFAAATLTSTLIVAYLTADLPAVKALFSSDFDKFFAADEWPFLLVCLLVISFGPGRISVDAILKKFVRPKLLSK
jgi:putative oxidoreductase